MLRLICKITASVKISFLCGHKNGVYAAASFAASMMYTQWQAKYLYINIICIAQWLFGVNLAILHYSGVFAQHQKLCELGGTFMQTGEDFFNHSNMTQFFSNITGVTSQLC